MRLLSDADWLSATEVSFNIDRERGSIDILAFHPSTGALLVVEVKSVVPDLQSMLHGIDRKARVARQVARERGWEVTSVSRLLILPDDRTSRRRVETHAATFDAALPARTVEVKRWLRTHVGRSPASCSCQMTLRRALVTESRAAPWALSVVDRAVPDIRPRRGHLTGIR